MSDETSVEVSLFVYNLELDQAKEIAQTLIQAYGSLDMSVHINPQEQLVDAGEL